MERKPAFRIFEWREDARYHVLDCWQGKGYRREYDANKAADKLNANNTIPGHRGYVVRSMYSEGLFS